MTNAAMRNPSWKLIETVESVPRQKYCFTERTFKLLFHYEYEIDLKNKCCIQYIIKLTQSISLSTLHNTFTAHSFKYNTLFVHNTFNFNETTPHSSITSSKIMFSNKYRKLVLIC